MSAKTLSGAALIVIDRRRLKVFGFVAAKARTAAMKSITIIVILRTTIASPLGFVYHKAKNVRKYLKKPQPTLQFNKRLNLFALGVAVGTIIADRPPHRTVRAALPHTAPTSDE
jgi:hypothetical protein